jgi:hypothetical protein
MILLSSILLLSCAAQLKQKILDEPYRSSALSVPITVSDIVVVDGRNSVDTRSIKAPKFTFKQKGDTITPHLTIEQEKVIHDEIRHSVKGDGLRVRIKATLKDGIKQYTLGFFNAREFAKTAITFEIMNDTARTGFFSTTGEANYEVKSTGADTVYLETLYRKALKTSVYKAFESIGEFMEKQKTGAVPDAGSGG